MNGTLGDVAVEVPGRAAAIPPEEIGAHILAHLKVEAVQAYPGFESTTWFQSLIAEKYDSVFQL